MDIEHRNHNNNCAKSSTFIATLRDICKKLEEASKRKLSEKERNEEKCTKSASNSNSSSKPSTEVPIKRKMNEGNKPPAKIMKIDSNKGTAVETKQSSVPRKGNKVEASQVIRSQFRSSLQSTQSHITKKGHDTQGSTNRKQFG